MFRYGIKALDIKQGYKSYLAIKQFCKLSINEVKDGVKDKQVLPIWEFNARDLTKLKTWHTKIHNERRLLNDAGVDYESYVHHDELGWQPITDLESLFQRDTEILRYEIEREQQSAQALARYRQGNDSPQALDELIHLMSDEMRQVLYEHGASTSFNARLNRMLPMLDASETRMLAYELDSHVRRQALNPNTQFNTATAASTSIPIELSAEHYTSVETTAHVATDPQATVIAESLTTTPLVAPSTANAVNINTDTPPVSMSSVTSAPAVAQERFPWWLLLPVALLLLVVWLLG